MKNIKLVATDLDGTFLKNDRTISDKNLNALKMLGENNIIRVAATGRNLDKVKQVINGHVPFDYIVFSSGAGVFDWKDKKHIFNQNINKGTSTDLLNYFVGRNINFHAFYPVPDNHQHWYFRGEKACEEFERYFSFNQANAIEIKKAFSPEGGLSQFLVIIPEVEDQFEKLKQDIEGINSDIRVIRSSSPITKGYIWIEVFQNQVSKGNGLKFVCDRLGIEYINTLGIGNDYNDFDLLDFTGHSFITENAPAAIADRYTSSPSNENDAFAFVTQDLLK
jgi:Cof subfamily protein (haloacid dehalogenase superfamily)